MADTALAAPQRSLAVAIPPRPEAGSGNLRENTFADGIFGLDD